MLKPISYKDYSQSIVSFFKFLKDSKNHNELLLKSIKVKKNKDLILVPISKIHLNDNLVLQKLCDWRNKNSKFFIKF